MQVNPKNLLAAGALIFWGLQTQFLWPSFVLAGIVGASAFTRQRLSLTPREFARLWDVTALILLGAALYQRQTSSISGAVLTFLQWLPMLLFPLLAASVFSTCERLPYSTFVFWWRGGKKRDERGVDFTYVYFGISLLAASASANRASWFYAGTTLLIAVALWLNRPRRASRALTLIMMATVASLGFIAQDEWRDMHAELENKTVSWFAGFFPRPFEDQETFTSLGDVARLKNSARVLMRIEASPGSAPPRLLRQVSFDQYRRGSWLAARRAYTPVAEAPPGTWDLSPADGAINSARLAILAPEGRILLPLPTGASRVRDLAAARLERNRFGNLRVWDCGDPLECAIDYTGLHSHEPPPIEKDLQVPGADEAAVREIVQELALDSMPPREALLRIGTFFTEHFRYETAVSDSRLSSTSASLVAPFLQTTRSGHCEYFATSAALILRKIGIPARYAMGYAAVESAGDRRTYRIRERHAHSWVLAYIDGKWMDFDPTPGAWAGAEMRQHTSILSRASDVWANLKFSFATMRLMPELSVRTLWWGAGCLTLAAAWRLWRRRISGPRKRSTLPAIQAWAWPGLDSEFFEVERSLRQRGLKRNADETCAAWCGRVARQCSGSEMLQELVKLHYRYRFDPAGLTAEERQRLACEARSWVSREMKAGTR